MFESNVVLLFEVFHNTDTSKFFAIKHVIPGRFAVDLLNGTGDAEGETWQVSYLACLT
jgi:hypothetical protein